MTNKEKIQQTYRFLINNSDDRFHTDSFVRSTYYEFYFWLQTHGWYHFRILKRKLYEKDNPLKLKSNKKQFCKLRKEFDYDCRKCYLEFGTCRFFSPPPIKNTELTFLKRKLGSGKLSTLGKKVWNGGREDMPIETKGEVHTLTDDKGRFTEVSLKQGDYGLFVSISKGEYWSDGNGNSGKRYKSNVTVSPKQLGQVITALQECQSMIE
jgi:hypothetical protein